MMDECPEVDVLCRFAAGALVAEELPALEAHLDDCAACRVVVTAALPESAPALPRSLGRYRLEAPLARGGMGIVYRATDTVLERAVAVKMLRVGGDDEAQARLLREARVMARLAHPNVVTVHDFGEVDGDVFIAMELVDGVSLDAWCRQGHPPAAIVACFAEAGRGLSAAHDAGLVHRDFKPSNVVVGRDGRARVTDFGLSRVEAPSDLVDLPLGPLTRTGSLAGTPAYMSPEQLDGQPVDARTDQFSFCVALTEALTGHRPWTATSTRALRTAMKAPPQLPRALPRALAATLRRGLSVDPAHRFPSMTALLSALTSTPTRVTWRLVAGGVAAAGLVAVAAVGGFLSSPRPAPLAPAPPPPTPAEPPLAEPPPVELLPGEGLLSLHVGRARRLWIPGVVRFSVSNADVLDTELTQPNVMTFFPMKEGRTTVTAWTEDEQRVFKVVIKPSQPQENFDSEP